MAISEAEVWLAGFDAGQTHSRCRLAIRQPDGTIEIQSEGEGPGVRHLAAPDGPEQFQQALRLSLAAADRQSGRRPPLAAAAIGASGIERGTDRQAQGRTLAAAALALPEARLLVTGDEHTALRGAFSDGCGLLLICGTGTIAIGRNATGTEARCAGWGWLLDQAGSTHDIGRDGLAASLRMADGRTPDGPLRQRLWHQLGLDPEDPQAPQQLKGLVVTPGFAPAGFAALAPTIDQLAEAGDAEATAIVRRSAEALVMMAVTLSQRLGLPAPAVCGVGGGFEHLTSLRRSFGEGLAQRLPEARWLNPVGDACQGALLLAAELL
ncbi:MAG: BadF/BadG/BcrA/BcrD ATPase family protein [Cyanobacteriota bacterium]